MLHEECEDVRETKVTALLAGEIICTNQSAFKLVNLEEDEADECLDYDY